VCVCIYILYVYTLGFTQPPIQWVPEAFSPGVKRPGREADHSPPNSAEVKKMWTCNPLPHTPSRCSALLVKHRNNFTLFYLYMYSHIHVGMNYDETSNCWSEGNDVGLYPWDWGFEFLSGYQVSLQGCRVFLQCLHETANILPRSPHGRFLPNHLQFIIICHGTISSLETDNRR
jgi:hypothetical protein